MAANYVEIKVKASDEAKPDIEALKFDLESLGSKVETARVEVDDKDASAKLLALNARLAELNRKVENPRLSTAGAAKVEAQIASIDAALDHLNDKHADPKVTLEGAAKVLAEVELLDHELDHMNNKGGLLTSMFSNLGSAMSSATVPLPLFGSVGLPGLAALVPVAGALLTEATGLASGFAAAGAGAGAFGLLALPSFHAVSGALAQVKADQNAYDRALTQTGKNTALAHLQRDLAKLDPAQRSAVKGLENLSDTFHKITKAFEPEALKVFNAGLNVLNGLLPALTPMAKAFADALTPLLNQFAKFEKSPGFQKWLQQFTSMIGPALTAIGNGLAKAGPALGKLMTTLSRQDVVNAINIAFSLLTLTINGLILAVQTAMGAWDRFTSNLHGISHAFDEVRHAFATAGHDIAHAFDNVRHGLADSAHSWAQSFDHVRHDIAAKFDGIKNAIVSKFAGAANWLKGAAHDIAHAFDNVRHGIASKFDGIRHDIAAKFDGAIGWLLSAGKDVVQGLIDGLNSMIPGLKGVVNTIVGTVKSIAGLLGIHSPSTVMRGYGVNIMEGLLGGIGSKVPDLRSQMGDVSRMIGGMQGPGGGRGGGAVQLEVMRGGGSAFEQFMVQAMRNYVRVRGGNVQAALGH